MPPQVSRKAPMSIATAIDAIECERSLITFVERGWGTIEPLKFQSNWHLDAISEHLEAVANRQIKRLLINIPPRHGKSLVANVFFPAWVWAQNGRGAAIKDGTWLGAGVKFMHLSYAADLSSRDSVKCRRLIDSKWYQDRWGDRFDFTADQNQKLRFENSKGGHRISTSVGGKVTGDGADAIIFDDPHNVKDGESVVERENVLRFWDESMPTRLNDAENGAFIVNMQRVHEKDLSGHILAKDMDWTHLCLPALYEPDHPHHVKTYVINKKSGSLWEDARAPGEPLWMERFKLPVLENWAKEMGTYACTPAESPVLMADLTMKPISHVKEGEIVVGFADRGIQNDAAYSRQHLTPTTVKRVFKYRAPVVRMTLDSGEVIRCTKDHKWYKKQRSDRDGAGNYGPANIGTKLARICPPTLPTLSAQDQRKAGWLAGFFDGDGSVSLCIKRGTYRASSSIEFYQGAGRNAPICEMLERNLQHFGFSFSYTEDRRKADISGATYGYRQYRLTGNSLPLYQKFLHIVQPNKWVDRIIAGAFGAKFIQDRERVIAIDADGEEDVFALETTTGNYVVWGLASSNSAGQLQQRPAPRAGGIFQKEWFEIVPAVPASAHVKVRAWDLAGTEEAVKSDPDYTVGLKMSRDPHSGFIYIEDVCRERYTPAMVKQMVKAIATQDGRLVPIRIPQDPGSSGKFVIADFASLLLGWPLRTEREDGTKEFRADPFAAQCEVGNVKLVKGKWNDAFLDEITTFPKGAHDDQVDAATAAFRCIADFVSPGAVSGTQANRR